MMDPETLIMVGAMLMIGATAGLFGGLLGIGGGIVMIPGLEILLAERYGPDSFHLYRLTAIVVALGLSIPAVVRHITAGALVKPILRQLVPAGLVGCAVGMLVAGMLVQEQTVWLKRLFGVYLVLVVLSDVRQWLAKARRDGDAPTRTSCPNPTNAWHFARIVGFPAGFTAGLLAVGGGIWAVPTQRMLGVRLRNAIANSAGMIPMIAVGTGVMQSVVIGTRTEGGAGNLLSAWVLIFGLLPTAVTGAWIGAGLTHRLPIGLLRVVFDVLLLVAGVRLILAAPSAAVPA